MKIEKAKRSDLPSIKKIYREEKKKVPSYFDNFIGKPNKYVYVAREGKKVLGFVMVKKGVVYNLFVGVSERNKGAGTELTKFILKKFKNLKLRVRHKNKLAIDFYKKIGFKKIRIIKNYYKNGDNAFLMCAQGLK